MSNPLIVDNSILSTYRGCVRKGFLRHKKHLNLQKVAAPLNFGGAIHAGAAHFQRGHTKEEAITKAFKAMRPQEWKESEWRTPEKMIKVLDMLLTSPLPKPLTAPNGQPVVEADFCLPLYETMQEQEWIMEKLKACGYDDVLFAGRIDLLAEDMGQKKVVDYKTTSKLKGNTKAGEKKYIDPRFWDAFHPHGATPMYCWGASKIIGEPVRSVLIIGIGADKYGEALGNHTFDLHPDEIEEARQNTLRFVGFLLDLEKANLLNEVYNPDNCFDFGSTCIFNQMCKVPRVNREAMEQIYVVDIWDPLAREEVED